MYLSALTKVYDPHSQYLSPKTLEDFRIMMKQKLVGIGAILSIDPRNGYCTIREIMPGGPADLDGRLRVNDRIVGVAQGPSELVDVFDMKLRDTVRLIRGKLGSQVRLEIIPADADDTSTRQLVELTRNEISVTLQKAKARHITIPASEGAKEMKLGVIELPSFYGDDDGNSTTADVYALLQELLDVGIDGLVLDLRSNGGGLLNEAIRLTGLFIDRGPVVQVKNSLGRRTTYEDIEPDAAYKGPLVVLTNKLSASASEIVAGALQDYARAIVIGDKSTHGKGTVQTVAQLGEYLKRAQEEAASAGAMKLTVQQFYLPDGESTQGRGVIPDIIFPSVNDYLEIGEDTLPHSLPWDEISSTEFEPCQDGLSQIIPSLLSRSLARVQENEDFSLLLEDISNLRERLETKQESLNIAQRLSEKKKRDELSDLKDARSDAKYDHLPDLISITFNEDGNLERNVESKTKPTDEDKDSTKPNFTVSYTRDPYLQETLNILTDLVLIESNQLSLDQVALS
ncbi:MAG: carboxy terminal-processing peptidase, partial [Verrucomicrobiota bacterium]